MTLYSIYPDLENYTAIGFDRNEIRAKFGSNPKLHIDLTSKPISYLDTWQKITISLANNSGGLTGSKIPDISPFKGKLFLSQKAYDTLRPAIQSDGEFLPVTYEEGAGYIFNPLRTADDVDGLDTKISRRSALGEIDAMSFHEDRTSQYMIFKSSFDHHQSVICQEEIKNLITDAKLRGVYFTEDLGNPLSQRLGSIIQPS